LDNSAYQVQKLGYRKGPPRAPLILEMGVIKEPLHEGKRHEFVVFLSALIPLPKIDTNGELGLEFPVIGFIVEKVQNLIAKKVKAKKEERQALKSANSTSAIKSSKSATGVKSAKSTSDVKSAKSTGEDEKQKEPKSDDLAPGEDEKKADPKSSDPAIGDEKHGEPKSDDVPEEDEKPEDPEADDDEPKEVPKPEVPDEKNKARAEDRHLEDGLESTMSTSKPDTTWEKVAGLHNAKCQLQMAAELPEKQPSLFLGNRKAPQFILLYGPPGTGKGHLAKALCNSVDSTLFIVSASDMTSKWVGESER
jgi:SpoVK/Ycf46/Vps4 family AAA+-type ATPase